MQDPDGIINVVEWVKQDLSQVLKLKYCKEHDFLKRKKLTDVSKVWYGYDLLRVKIKYKEGRETITKNVIVYPCDVIRYGRKTIGVMEEVARDRFQSGKSGKEIAKKYYAKYGFSLSCLRRTLKKVKIGFERLIVSKLIPAVHSISGWLKNERKSLCQMRVQYFRNSFSLSPPFQCILC
jgi:hypothetical protein